MKATVALSVLQALVVHGIRILQGNDDGWAELYTRDFGEALRASGHDVVLSAPAEDKSVAYVDPEKRTKPCHYDSCQPKSERFGHNETRPELNWVNSFPVTAVRFGIETVGPQCWGGYHPELVVAGPNVGRSAWLAVQYSGNAAVAAYAARAQIPAIAFSAASGSRLPWDTDPAPKASAVYAELARNLTNTVIASGKPYLPPDIFLNVNFPPVDERCPDAASFKWILTRMNPGIHEPRDLLWCNRDRLPTENYVRHGPGCYISVSPGDAYTKKTSEDVRKQEVILKKLQSILSCFP